MTDEPSDDVGESLMRADADFEPPEVPFQPKPTSVSVALAPSNDFSSESNFTTMPKVDEQGRRLPSQAESRRVPTHRETRVSTHHDQQPPVHEHGDIHAQNTVILPDRGRHASHAQPAARQPQPTSAQRASTRRPAQPPPPPPSRPRGATIAPSIKPIYDEDLHAAPTQIIDINRMRRRRG